MFRAIDTYIDGLIAPFFKTDDKGRRLFFPLGVWGKGRVLPDDATATEVRRRLRKAYIAAMSTVLIGMAASNPLPYGPVWAIAIGAIVTVVMVVYTLRLAKPFAMSEVRMSLGEAQLEQAKSMGPGWMFAFTISCLVFAGIALLALIFDTKETILWSLPSVPIFGFMAYMFGRLWLKTRKGKASEMPPTRTA